MTCVQPRPGWAYVEGPVHCALYDTAGGLVLHLRGDLARLARGCASGKAVENGLDERDRAKANALIESLLRLPCFEPCESSVPWERWGSTTKADTHRLRGAYLEQTSRCNLRCRHCYADAGMGPGVRDLDAAFWHRMLAEVQALGGGGVVLTGGEPLVHPGFAELFEDACTRFTGGHVSVLTNGTLVDDATVALFAKHRPRLSMSFYASAGEKADAMTGVPGSFQKTVAAFRRLLAAGVPFGVNVILPSEAGHELPGIRAFLEGLGIPEKQIGCNPVLPTGRGCSLRSEIESLRSDFPHEASRPFLVAGAQELGCGTCWQGQLTIAADGRVLLCNMLRDLSVGDVTKESLHGVISSERCQSAWSFSLDQVEDCKVCELRFSCYDCRAKARILGGTLTAKNPLCPYDPRSGQSTSATHVSSRLAVPAGSRPRRSPLVRVREAGDELVVSDAQGRDVFALNPLAARIFELCDGSRGAQDIAQLLFEEYDVELDRLRADVDQTLLLLRTRGLLENG